MLEDLAIKIVSQDEDTLHSIGLLVTFIGFVLALIVHSEGKSELERAPYFALPMLMLLMSSAISFMWMFSLKAAARGVLWMLVGSLFLSIACIGYFYGMIALGRSRDAFGTGRYAILGLVPLANFVLLLKQSKDRLSPNRILTIPLLSGGTGVVSGFVMAAASVMLTASFETYSDEMVENADPEQSIAFLLRSRGLDGALETIAAEARLPVTVDEVTTLATIEADGTRLRRTYVVTLEPFSLTTQFRAIIQNSICDHAPFTLLLREGATIEEFYVAADGSPIGTHVVTQHSCVP